MYGQHDSDAARRETDYDPSEKTNLTGSANPFLESVLALEVAINAPMSLKTGFSVRRNTDVEPGWDQTDYLSTVNLVYSFR
ncbi:MAG: DUF481 domain-containing protein [Xanthomonadaceae bacterium]|nr:DUF481 domain-containing protein [Xanthomonadaceae bacterium]